NKRMHLFSYYAKPVFFLGGNGVGGAQNHRPFVDWARGTDRHSPGIADQSNGWCYIDGSRTEARRMTGAVAERSGRRHHSSVRSWGLTCRAAARRRYCRQRPWLYCFSHNQDPDPTSRHCQSALAPENLTTLAHFSVSSANSFAKSAGEPGSGVPPRSA